MVTDRWPTNVLGKMDGPRIVLGKDSGWLESSCKKLKLGHMMLCQEQIFVTF